jgi:hypothetical protein
VISYSFTSGKVPNQKNQGQRTGEVRGGALLALNPCEC